MNTNSAKIKTVDPKFEMIDPMLAKTRGNTLFQARYGGECLCVSYVYYVHICLYIYIYMLLVPHFARWFAYQTWHAVATE